jgi:hypothetical protein
MTKRTWHITLDDAPHFVEMEYGNFIRDRRILVDGKLVVKERKGLYGSLDQFKIGNHQASLEIFSDGFRSRQLLYLGAEAYVAREDNPTLSVVKQVRTEHAFWFNLGKSLGLQYVATPKAMGFWKHRLVGMSHNRLIWIKHSNKAANARPALLVLIRYNPLLEQEYSFQQLIAHPNIENLLEDKKSAVDQINSFQSWFRVPYSDVKEKGEEVAERIKQLLVTLSQHTRPIKFDECEGLKCKSRHNQHLQLVLVNDSPQLLCLKCIEDIPSWGDDYRRDYQKVPWHLGRGMLVSVLAAILCAPIWAVVTILLDRIGAIFAIAIFVVALHLMKKVETKFTLISVSFAAAASGLGVVFGVFLTFLWFVLREVQWQVSPESLILYMQVAWEVMLTEKRLLDLSLFMYALGVVPYLGLLLYQGQRQLNQLFRPRVEVIGYVPTKNA